MAEPLENSSPQRSDQEAVAPSGRRNDVRLEAVGENSNAAMMTLLRVEAEARRVDSPQRLVHLITNETRKLIRARQVFVLKRSRSGTFVVEAISSIDVVERDAPLVRWIERMVKRLAGDSGLGDLREFSLPAYCDADDDEVKTYPFRNFQWAPMKLRDGMVFAGMLAAREQVWLETDNVVAKRLADCFAHAWSALAGTRRLKRTGARKRYLALVAALLTVVAMTLPVPMTALAPAEIVPRDAFVVSAPLDGIVRRVDVLPNASVTAGEVLLNIDDVRLRNELELAESHVAVARAKLKRAAQAAFGDPDARRELRLAMSDLRLRETERNYARELLAKVAVKADRPGLAVFGSAKDWTGKPVKTGEKIMEIADPDKIEVRINLALGDSIVLARNAEAQIFLDSDPLNPLAAKVIEAGHEAVEDASGVLSYRLTGALDPDQSLPRIGARGTAQVYGADTALFFYLFRRPISYLRQKFGL